MSYRTSFGINIDQRYKIKQIKEKLEKELGRRIFDQDLMDMLLRTFQEHQHKDFIAEAQKLVELAKETIVIAEDVEKLKEEVEELRKENERLREELKKQVTVSNAREAFVLFVRKVTEEAEGQLSKETQDKLLTILTELHGIFNGSGLNWERIKEIAEAISR